MTHGAGLNSPRFGMFTPAERLVWSVHLSARMLKWVGICRCATAVVFPASDRAQAASAESASVTCSSTASTPEHCAADTPVGDPRQEF
jgi:hypothetical protein